MGIFRKFSSRFSGPHKSTPAPASATPRATGQRVCRFEAMEPRQMLAADLHLGAVYYEPDEGTDTNPDYIEITFQGGAQGTELTRIVINGDKKKDGLSDADIFFDHAPGGLGVDQHSPFKVVSAQGFQVLGHSVSADGMTLTIDLKGFEAGEKLIFTIDVDEVNFVADNGDMDVSPIVEGKEFQRSHFSGMFKAKHYEDLTMETVFWDVYDDDFQKAAQEAGTTLNLPNDRRFADNDVNNRTAGAVAHAPQVPKPISISGTVFADMDLDNFQDSGEQGISGVKLSLWKFNEATGQYEDTGKIATTDGQGFYKFDKADGKAILPGRYEIRETQPAPYFSVGATPGKVEGGVRGAVKTVDVLTQIDLQGGEDSVKNDFAEALPAQISGYVYHDRDNDGVRDAGEEGLANVRIDVIAVNTVTGSKATKTVFTNAQGFYEATGLVPGEYRVIEFAQPAGYLDGKDAVGTVSGAKIGEVINPGDEIKKILLLGGKAGLEYNFGELKPSSIAGQVHADPEGDCKIGPNDVLLEGVRIDLLNAKGELLKTTYTDKDGRYKFDGLPPGVYKVFEHQPTQYLDGGDHIGSAGGKKDGVDTIYDIALTSGTVGVGYDFCENFYLTLAGNVYHDRDDDGVKDSGEEGIGGVTVELLDSTGKPTGKTTQTDSQGRYKFEGLTPGKYSVREIQPTGWLDGKDTPGNRGGSAQNPGDLISGATLDFGKNGAEYNFGELKASSIAGQVHADPEGDCKIGPNDVLLEGVRIDLLNAKGELLKTTYTDQDGRYKFDALPPGVYKVFEHQPTQYIDGGDHIGSAGGIRDGNDTIALIKLTSGTTAVGYDFCENFYLTLAGNVYHDRDDDGLKESGEEGIGGVTVELLDSAGKPTGKTTKTDSQGRYKFEGLTPGTYSVREIQPTGWLDGKDTPGNRGGSAQNPGDLITGATLDFGKHGVEYNFGELRGSSIAGQVHADPEGDCKIGPNDIFLEGVRIDLLNAKGELLKTTYTDQDGRYKFDALPPGVYKVFEHQPTAYLDGGDHIGTAGGKKDGVDTIYDIKLTSGTEATGYDFCENLYLTLSGYVYHDKDNDGVKETGEQGIGGVTLELLDENCEPTGRTTKTDSQGRYKFDGLAPGKYGVREYQPAGWLDGKDTPGNRGGVAKNGDEICLVTLEIAQNGENYNFGELLPGSIRGRVIADRDGDCVLDENESPIAGVTIELLNQQGQVIKTTKTDQNGNYAFTGLSLGSYSVREIQPTGFFHQAQHIGSGGGVVLGTDHVGGIVIGSGTHLVSYDFCEAPPAQLSGYVFQDGDVIRTFDGQAPANLNQIRDGQRTNDDKPLANVVLELRHGVTGEIITPDTALPGVYSGTAIRATTDANGHYQFVGLPAGIYAVFQVHPGDYVDGIDTPGTTGGIAVNKHQPLSPAILSPLASNPNDDAILRIRLGTGESSVENNFSEVVIEETPLWFRNDPPPAPPTPLNPLGPAPQAVFTPEMFQPPIYARPDLPYGTSMVGYTWHLSVVDAGFPRSIQSGDMLVQLTGAQFDAQAWHSRALDESSWSLRGEDGELQRRFVFGRADATPVTGDFNGDGVTEMGVFIKGEWFIDLNGNGEWDEGDLWAKLGHDGDLPVTGDWDGDGKTDIGIFGPAWPGDPRAVAREPGLPDPENLRVADRSQNERYKNVPPRPDEAALGARTMKLTSQGKLRADVIDHVFHYGTAGDRPTVGDWNGDGIDTIAVFRHGTWHLDVDGDGKFTDRDVRTEFGQRGDLPVIGDWNGDGVDQIGVYREGRFILDTNNNREIDATDAVFDVGADGDLPIVGDFNGDGVDQVGVYTPHASSQQQARR